MVGGRVADRSREREQHPQGASPTLVVDADPVDRASVLVSAALLETLERRASARLAIPGGSALEVLPGVVDRLGPRWGRVALTWVDERCVPVEDEDSNRGAVARRGLLPTGDGASPHPQPLRILALYEDRETPEEAVQRVLAGLSRDFDDELDVVLLGMGSDGHIASLFPGAAAPAPSPGRALVAHIRNSPKPPADRITLTREILATAPHKILMVSGEAKRDALRRLLQGDPRLPASGLEALVIVTDLDLESESDSDTAGRTEARSEGPWHRE